LPPLRHRALATRTGSHEGHQTRGASGMASRTPASTLGASWVVQPEPTASPAAIETASTTGTVSFRLASRVCTTLLSHEPGVLASVSLIALSGHRTTQLQVIRPRIVAARRSDGTTAILARSRMLTARRGVPGLEQLADPIDPGRPCGPGVVERLLLVLEPWVMERRCERWIRAR